MLITPHQMKIMIFRFDHESIGFDPDELEIFLREQLGSTIDLPRCRDLPTPQPKTGRAISTSEQIAAGIPDPEDLPDELVTALIALRAVRNGYGDPAATFRNRLMAWLAEHRSDLTNDAQTRIATVANPDKTRGRPAAQRK